MYKIYKIVRYQTLAVIGTALVAAESEEDSLSLLEETLKNHPSHSDVVKSNEGNISFEVREDGGVFETEFKTDKKGLIALFPYDNSPIEQ